MTAVTPVFCSTCNAEYYCGVAFRACNASLSHSVGT